MARIITIENLEANISEETLAAYSRKRGFGSKNVAYEDILVIANDLAKECSSNSEFQNKLDEEINKCLSEDIKNPSADELKMLYERASQTGGF